MIFFSRFFFSFLFFSFFLSISPLAFAEGDLFFNENSFRISPEYVLKEKEMKMYISVQNTTSQDMKGVVRAFDSTEGKKIEVDQTFTAIANGKADIFFLFVPEKLGMHEVAFRLIPWEVYTQNENSNDKILKNFFVDVDFDNDGIGDQSDLDDDNDGTPDTQDIFPFNRKESKDSDGDKIGDNADTDNDNDGILNENDAFPFDAAEADDTDGDKIGDNEDDDDDGDGIRDNVELQKGTDTKKKDTDEDGVDDAADDYPLDKKFQFDTDKDGISNADDSDDDNDGISDQVDLFPLNKDEFEDFDKDGIGNFSDPDDDNDGFLDEEEKKMGSNSFDEDTDKDGTIDGKDAIPLDPTETKDSDNDGIGDNADSNDENKGPVIVPDLFLDSFEAMRSEIFSLDLAKSYDPEGGNLQFIWDIVDKKGNVIKTTQGEKFEVKFSSIGKKNIRLTVTDEADETRIKDFIISVYWSKTDIWFVIFLLIFLYIVGTGVYFIWRRKKTRRVIRKQ